GTRLAGDTSAALSNVGRTLVRQDSFTVVHHHGLTGIGLQWLFQPHNLVLGVLAATGVIGFLGLVIVVLSVARRLVTTATTDTWLRTCSSPSSSSPAGAASRPSRSPCPTPSSPASTAAAPIPASPGTGRCWPTSSSRRIGSCTSTATSWSCTTSAPCGAP